jgi:hypothetical protein
MSRRDIGTAACGDRYTFRKALATEHRHVVQARENDVAIGASKAQNLVPLKGLRGHWAAKAFSVALSK